MYRVLVLYFLSLISWTQARTGWPPLDTGNVPIDLLRFVGCIGPHTSAPPRKDLVNTSEGNQRSFDILKSHLQQRKKFIWHSTGVNDFVFKFTRSDVRVWCLRVPPYPRNKRNKFPVEIEHKLHYLHGRYSLIDSCKSETIGFVPAFFDQTTPPVRARVLWDRTHDPWIQIDNQRRIWILTA